MSDNVDTVKAIMGIEDDSIDLYLSFCEQKLIDEILDRCNIEEIPGRLNSLIQEFLIEQYNINKNGIGNGKQEVSSASDNGQSVSFIVVGGASDMAKTADEFLDRNMSRLIPYRKLRW